MQQKFAEFHDAKRITSIFLFSFLKKMIAIYKKTIIVSAISKVRFRDNVRNMGNSYLHKMGLRKDFLDLMASLNKISFLSCCSFPSVSVGISFFDILNRHSILDERYFDCTR